MDTQKNENCNKSFYLAIVGAIMLMAGQTCFADDRAVTDVLTAIYRMKPEVTSTEVRLAIGELEKASPDCRNGHLYFRAKYETGVLYFKVRMMTESKNTFLTIAGDPDCPGLIRMCSFNMIGQISRLTKEDNGALGAFEQAVNYLEQSPVADKNHPINPALIKLCCSVLISRAEIYEQQQDYVNSINEYTHLLRILHQDKGGDLLDRYGPLASDRMSQLYLRQQKFDEYKKCVETLTADYPRYYRTPIIKLETESVKLLKSIPTGFEFSAGSFPAPAYLITYVKASKNEALGRQLANRLETLCKEYLNTYGGILLQYHYAWLLDTLDEKDKAAEIFARVYSAETGQIDDKLGGKTIIETVQEYAKIQSAIILGEKGDYVNALKILSKLKTHPDKSHISELAESVGKSIETLKREMPKDGKK